MKKNIVKGLNALGNMSAATMAVVLSVALVLGIIIENVAM